MLQRRERRGFVKPTGLVQGPQSAERRVARAFRKQFLQ
jgi:hypothetical protein